MFSDNFPKRFLIPITRWKFSHEFSNFYFLNFPKHFPLTNFLRTSIYSLTIVHGSSAFDIDK